VRKQGKKMKEAGRCQIFIREKTKVGNYANEQKEKY
jgi:hypothetical protein